MESREVLSKPCSANISAAASISAALTAAVFASLVSPLRAMASVYPVDIPSVLNTIGIRASRKGAMNLLTWMFVGLVVVSSGLAAWAWTTGAVLGGHVGAGPRPAGGILWVVFPAVVVSLALGALTLRRVGLAGGAIGFAVGALVTAVAEAASFAKLF